MQTALVLLSDLKEIQDTLNAAYYGSVAQDFVESYRKLNRQNRSSPMTLALERAHKKVEEYIEAAEAVANQTLPGLVQEASDVSGS